jgi:DNA repair protein RadC
MDGEQVSGTTEACPKPCGCAAADDGQPSFYVTTVRRRRQRRLPPEIRNPDDVFELLAPLVRGADREHFHVVYLSARYRCLGVELISLGTVDMSIAHAREIFKGAIKNSASWIILTHNHPDGDPEPSLGDRRMTKRFRRIGKFLGFPIIDHIVLGRSSFVSMAERGLL